MILDRVYFYNRITHAKGKMKAVTEWFQCKRLYFPTEYIHIFGMFLASTLALR